MLKSEGELLKYYASLFVITLEKLIVIIVTLSVNV